MEKIIQNGNVSVRIPIFRNNDFDTASLIVNMKHQLQLSPYYFGREMEIFVTEMCKIFKPTKEPYTFKPRKNWEELF